MVISQSQIGFRGFDDAVYQTLAGDWGSVSRLARDYLEQGGICYWTALAGIMLQHESCVKESIPNNLLGTFGPCLWKICEIGSINQIVMYIYRIFDIWWHFKPGVRQ